jgi:hypothetical protein
MTNTLSSSSIVLGVGRRHGTVPFVGEPVGVEGVIVTSWQGDITDGDRTMETGGECLDDRMIYMGMIIATESFILVLR